MWREVARVVELVDLIDLDEQPEHYRNSSRSLKFAATESALEYSKVLAKRGLRVYIITNDEKFKRMVLSRPKIRKNEKWQVTVSQVQMDSMTLKVVVRGAAAETKRVGEKQAISTLQVVWRLWFGVTCRRRRRSYK